MSTPIKKKQVNLNIEELKMFLGHFIENNKVLQAGGKVPVTVNIEGDAGLGKTSAVRQMGEHAGLQVVRLNLAMIEELGDLVGFPLRQFQLCKDTKCEWIDEQALEEYIKLGYEFTGEKRMGYCPPPWITGLEEKGGILLIDDYSRADQRFIQACMTLIETQKYISWELPKNWCIFLTTNPDDGEYLVTAMDEAQLTRFVTVNLKFDVNVWARWAEADGVDTRCINFLLMHPDLVTRGVNPRSITTFFNSIISIPDFSEKNAMGLIQMIGEGSVGVEFATIFTLFINNKLDKLITPKDILFHESDTHVIGELNKCIGKDKAYRNDIASVLTTRTINYAIHHAENNSVDQKMIDRIIKLCTDDVLTDDLKYVLTKKLLAGNKKKFEKIMADAKVMKMTMK